MRDNLRSFDPVVRYGGDEFICGLGGIDEQDVEQRSTLIDQSLRESVGTGISTGIAMLLPGETIETLVARADAAMFAGRRTLAAR